MSQENVELTRQAYEAWNNGDLDWMLDHMTEDFEFRPGLGFADIDPVIRGKDGWKRFLLTFDGRGRGSGVDVSIRVGQLGLRE